MPNFTLYWYQLENRKVSRKYLTQAAAIYLEKEERDMCHIKTGQWGKPYFPDYPDVFCSVTHSGSYWIAAFGSGPVGIDLQIHQPCHREMLSRRFFHSEEQAFLARRNYEEFYHIWTAKESYVKYTGQGIDGSFSTFCVADEWQGVMQSSNGAQFRCLPFCPGYTLYLCSTEIDVIQFLPGK